MRPIMCLHLPRLPFVANVRGADDPLEAGDTRSQQWLRRGHELRGMSLHRRMLIGNPNA
jgi:hypothetical protein